MSDERGSGLVGTVAGVAAVLAFLVLAVHVLLHLHATSLVSAAAFDAARVVSGAAHESSRAAAAGDAERNARSLLGPYGGGASFDWLALGPDQVVLRVRARTPSILPKSLGSLSRLDVIDRTVTVRAERFVDGGAP